MASTAGRYSDGEREPALGRFVPVPIQKDPGLSGRRCRGSASADGEAHDKRRADSCERMRRKLPGGPEKKPIVAADEATIAIYRSSSRPGLVIIMGVIWDEPCRLNAWQRYAPRTPRPMKRWTRLIRGRLATLKANRESTMA